MVRPFVDVGAHGGRKAEVEQLARPQIADDAANVVIEIRERLPQGTDRSGLEVQGVQSEAEGGEVSAELIVELARNATALFFLHRNELTDPFVADSLGVRRRFEPGPRRRSSGNLHGAVCGVQRSGIKGPVLVV